MTSAQLLEEIDEAPAASPSPAPAADAAPMEDVPAADAAAAPAKDENKMDTDEAKPAETKKVKINRQDLKIESFTTGGVDTQTLNAYFEKEVAMATQVRTTDDTTQQAASLLPRHRVSIDEPFHV